MKRIVMTMLMGIILSFPSFAQGYAPPDAGFVAEILIAKGAVKKHLNNQLGRMALQTSGHIWLEAEVDGLVNFHKEFNEYLSSFNQVLGFLAQLYGFYHEIDKLYTNFSDLTAVIARAPSNIVAVTLKSNSNKIQKELIILGGDILADINKVCFSKTKITEKERMEIVFSIRPKLKKFNTKLMHLTKAVRYTSLADVWREITLGTYTPKTKKEIAERCLLEWQDNCWGDLR